jgi:cation diffusion facilitator family transporter
MQENVIKEEQSEKSHGMLSVIVALIVNILIAISKFVGFFLSGSSSMLNESIHSVVDCANQVLLLWGDRKSKSQASDIHNFGQARAKYFFSTIVATMLFFGGGALGIYEVVRKILHPEHDVENMILVLVILAFAIILELFSFRTALKEVKVLNKEKLPILRFLKESRHSEIIIIFAEDFCALIGLLLALAATLIAHVTGNPVFDAIGGLLIGILLMFASILLARKFYSLIVGESVNEHDLAIIKRCFDRKEVNQLIDLKTVHLGPEEVLIGAKVDIVSDKEDEASEIINSIEKQIRADLDLNKAYIYIEVDEYKSDYQEMKNAKASH